MIVDANRFVCRPAFRSMWLVRMVTLPASDPVGRDLFDFNGGQYKRFKTAYEYRIDGIDATDPDEFVNAAVSDDAIKRVRDSARKNLELTYMAAIVVHALNGIEAFVDAHLRNFDVSEDLSLSIRPTFDTSSPVGIQSGIGLFVTF